MSILKRVIIAPLVVSALVLPGCGDTSPARNESPAFSSFRDIPGVTAEEISAIEAIQAKGEPLVYAALSSAEAFELDGEINGFAALYCELLTGLFGVEFDLRLMDWSEIQAGLQTGEVAFTGEMTATEERLRTGYHMTGAIAQRSIKYTQRAEDTSLSDIAESRNPPGFSGRGKNRQRCRAARGL